MEITVKHLKVSPVNERQPWWDFPGGGGGGGGCCCCSLMLLTYSCVGTNGLNGWAARRLMPSYEHKRHQRNGALLASSACSIQSAAAAQLLLIQYRKAWWVVYRCLQRVGETKTNPRHPVCYVCAQVLQHNSMVKKTKKQADTRVLHATCPKSGNKVGSDILLSEDFRLFLLWNCIAVLFSFFFMVLR